MTATAQVKQLKRRLKTNIKFFIGEQESYESEAEEKREEMGPYVSEEAAAPEAVAEYLSDVVIPVLQEILEPGSVRRKAKRGR